MSLKSQIRNQIKKMPKYKIQNEAFQNQAVARTAAFGQNRDVQMQRENIDQAAAESLNRAQDVTTSTSDLLSTIAAISASRNSTQRDLAITQAGLRQQGRQELYAANTAMIDEKDKAFYQNVYAPWEAKLRNLQERKANRTAFWNRVGGAIFDPGNFSGFFGKKTSAPVDYTNPSQSAQADQADQGEQDGKSKFAQLLPIMGAVFSDVNLKEQITDSKKGIDLLAELEVVEYFYKNDDQKKRHIGLIAQQVKDKIPEAIEKEGDYLKVNYTEIIPVMIKALQEQQKLISSLREEILMLKENGI